MEDIQLLRFPNPASTTSNFRAVYVAAFQRYRGQVVTLDDLVHATVSANLATSSGYAGKAAITRSTRTDRSRDPLYNQLKMYAELFRMLGWLHSTEHAALRCTFTLLGEQLVEAGPYWQSLLGETVLGIAYPNHVISNRSDQIIRPFGAILRTMLVCDDGLSRDEMIVGPLSMTSDRRPADFDAFSDRITALRDRPAAIRAAVENVANQRRVQVTTLRNYTRWPIAIMRDLGWTVKEREPYRESSRTFEIHRLTSYGKQIAENLESAFDIRVADLDQLPSDEKHALCRHAHFAMLERSGFDLTTMSDQLREEEHAYRDARRALGAPENVPLLFSPLQSLSVSDSTAIFSHHGTPSVVGRPRQVEVRGTDSGRSASHLFVSPTLVSREVEVDQDESDLDQLRTTLRRLHRDAANSLAAATAFAVSRRSDGQTEFYPLITNLIQLLGFDSSCSRRGDNYQRWDAHVRLDELVIPIEIKSPTEELLLSVKAVRQAMENKVILLARGGLSTTRDTTSLVVGYQMPNERGDMTTLIDDIDATFNLKIGVLDLRGLALLAIQSVTESLSVDATQLAYLKGFIDVRYRSS